MVKNRNHAPRFSVVTTLYRSAPFIEEFYRRIVKAVTTLTHDYEIVMVDDGSPDDSATIVKQIADVDPNVRLVQLSRNFGHHKAIMTGLDHTDGDLIFFVDCDLEEAPEHIVDFYEQLTAMPDADVIYGVQQEREGTWFRRFFGSIFYRLYNSLTAYTIPENLTTMRLMRRPYVDALRAHREKVFVIAALWTLTGFQQIAYPIRKSYKGTTSYNLSRKMAQIIYGTISVSARPLIGIAALGLFITVLTMITGMIYLTMSLLGMIGVVGWVTIVLSILLLGGMNLFATGIVAIYLSVIFQEVKERPYTIVKTVYQQNRSAESFQRRLGEMQ